MFSKPSPVGRKATTDALQQPFNPAGNNLAAGGPQPVAPGGPKPVDPAGQKPIGRPGGVAPQMSPAPPALPMGQTYPPPPITAPIVGGRLPGPIGVGGIPMPIIRGPSWGGGPLKRRQSPALSGLKRARM